MNVISTKLLLLVCLYCGVASRSTFPYHDTQNSTNTPEVLQLLETISRTLDHLATVELTSIVVELELVIAKVNLEYLLENLDPAAERRRLQDPMLIIISKLQASLSTLPIQYVTPDVGRSMKIFTSYQNRLKRLLTPISLGLIGYQHPLRMEKDSYKRIILSQGNLYHKTELCLQKLLQSGNEPVADKCTIDLACYGHLTSRDQYAVYLVQAGLYIIIAKYFNCEPARADDDLARLCENMYGEMLMTEQFGYPEHFSEVFALHMSFCGSAGFGEFMKPRWMRKVLSWEEEPGAFRNSLSGDKDSSILSAEAVGCAAVYIRAMLETEQTEVVTNGTVMEFHEPNTSESTRNASISNN